MPALTKSRPPTFTKATSTRFSRFRQSLSKRGKFKPMTVPNENVSDSNDEPRESRDPPSLEDAAEAKSNEPGSELHSPLLIPSPMSHPNALKILFLSSDTGGGHRASATSLAQQFHLLFPGSIHALCDIVQLDGPPPYSALVKTYRYLSAHPQQWKLVYSVSNTRAYEMLADVHMKSAMEYSARRRIASYDPDVVVSVHPLMTNVPVLACANISKETGRHLPIFTVCTDLGSAHTFWFANGVEKLFVASEAIAELARSRGKVVEEKIVISGLPIRNDFSLRAKKMGTRHSDRGRKYRRTVIEGLGLQKYRDHQIVLVMGGGEGCGRLSHIVDSLYLQFVDRNMKALILVVCGRNDELREGLSKKDWEAMRTRFVLARNDGYDFDSCVGILSDGGLCGEYGYGVAHHLRRIISSPSMLGGYGLGRVENPFSSIGGEREGSMGERDGGFREFIDVHSTSLPNSRSHSPTMELLAAQSVEVVTQSFAEKEDLYDLSTLISTFDDDKLGNEGGKGTHLDKTATSNTEPLTSSQSSELDGEIEVIEESVSTKIDGCKEMRVQVIGLGFVTNMADYMVAADVLVSKAGPGTIAEAASLSLPVMLTSFLPGQEEGNVDYVIGGGFGNFISDSDPHGISEEVASWLLDEDKIKALSENAHKRGAPDAAAEIVKAIGTSALRWKKINEQQPKPAETIVRGDDAAEVKECS